MLPALLVITSEHISHQVVTSNIIGQNLLQDRVFTEASLRIISQQCFQALSEEFRPQLMVKYRSYGSYKSLFILCNSGCCDNFNLYGIYRTFEYADTKYSRKRDRRSYILLYGMIGTSGIRLLVDEKVDYSNGQNLILTSISVCNGS